MEYDQNRMCRVFKAIAEPKRFRIIVLLSQGRMSASEILKQFHVTQPTLSHDMRLLLDAELVTDQRIGKAVYYELNRDMLTEVSELLKGIIDSELEPVESFGEWPSKGFF